MEFQTKWTFSYKISKVTVFPLIPNNKEYSLTLNFSRKKVLDIEKRKKNPQKNTNDAIRVKYKFPLRIIAVEH